MNSSMNPTTTNWTIQVWTPQQQFKYEPHNYNLSIIPITTIKCEPYNYNSRMNPSTIINFSPQILQTTTIVVIKAWSLKLELNNRNPNLQWKKDPVTTTNTILPSATTLFQYEAWNYGTKSIKPITAIVTANFTG